MRSDLGKELNEIAPAPRSRLDLGTVWLRAQQLQRRRLISYGLAICVLVGGTGAAVLASPFDLNRPGRIGTTVNPSETIREIDRETRLRELRARLQTQLVELEARLEQVRGVRIEVSARLQEALRSGSSERSGELVSQVELLKARGALIVEEIDHLRARLTAIARRMAKQAVPPGIERQKKRVTDNEKLDARAHVLIGQAGGLCRDYDFHEKGVMGGQTFRPVRCEVPGSERPRFILNVYPSRDGVRAKLADAAHARIKLFVLVGVDWTAESLDEDALRRLQERLGGTIRRFG